MPGELLAIIADAVPKVRLPDIDKVVTLLSDTVDQYTPPVAFDVRI